MSDILGELTPEERAGIEPAIKDARHRINNAMGRLRGDGLHAALELNAAIRILTEQRDLLRRAEEICYQKRRAEEQASEAARRARVRDPEFQQRVQAYLGNSPVIETRGDR